MASRREKGDRGLGGETSHGPRPGSFSSALDRLVLQAVDPYWAQAAWSVDPRSIEVRRERLGDPSCLLVLRFHALPPLDVIALPGWTSFEVEVAGAEGNYYATFWRGGHLVEAELGLRASSGLFLPIVRSNRIELPPDGESPRYEVRWQRALGAPSALWRSRFAGRERCVAIREEAVGGLDAELAREIAAPASGAPAPSPPPPGPWEPVLHAACEVSAPGARVPLASEALEALPETRSQGQASGPSGAAATVEPSGEAVGARAPWPAPAQSLSPWPQLPETTSSAEVSSFRKQVREERPYLEVRADIVIYGVARPGSELVIEGVKVPVRTDGTFDVRFSLPASGSAAGENAPPERPSESSKSAPEGYSPGGGAGRGGGP